jgi:hypothetical protein
VHLFARPQELPGAFVQDAFPKEQAHAPIIAERCDS